MISNPDPSYTALRYEDYYNCMSYADFLSMVEGTTASTMISSKEIAK